MLFMKSFGEPYTSIARAATMVRYSLLPLWYTTFYESYVTGQPVMRTMFSEFPDDARTFAMDDQWLVGGSLLVKPATFEGQTSVDIYMPFSSNSNSNSYTDGWYDLHTLERVPIFESGILTVQVPLELIPVYIRSGTTILSKVHHCTI